jgi:hypothetical protein
MLMELGHQVWVGDATEIRRLAKRRQKNDRCDAEHILEWAFLLRQAAFNSILRGTYNLGAALREVATHTAL